MIKEPPAVGMVYPGVAINTTWAIHHARGLNYLSLSRCGWCVVFVFKLLAVHWLGAR